MPAEPQTALHSSVIHCIGRWRRILGIGRKLSNNANTLRSWQALQSIHEAWCAFSECEMPAFLDADSSRDFAHSMPPAATSFH